MTNRSSTSLVFSICAGCACSFAGAADLPTTLDTSDLRVRDIAHIYYNIASGERIVTLINNGQTSGADTGNSVSIWANISNPCDDVDPGLSTAFFYVADDNSGTTSLATAATTVDWADISVDTVVDCVRINWVTGHVDTDSDSDGIGDGVIGLGGQWTWWDADNGRFGDRSTRTPLISFVFFNLPGDPNPNPEFAAGYTADIDLASSLASSLVFEICDTDSDLQDATIHNAGIGNLDNNFDGLPDSDLDGDGLADWSWGVRFFQPGTFDFDGDGVVDGDLADSMHPIGMTPAAPEGDAIPNGDGTWSYEIDLEPDDAGTGSEDAFAIYGPDGVASEFFWFGGMSCDPDDDGFITPYASFHAQLFGPGDGGSCPQDTNGDGVINFFDITGFIVCFNVRAPCGDWNADGDWDFFDVAAFLADFAAGCP